MNIPLPHRAHPVRVRVACVCSAAMVALAAGCERDTPDPAAPAALPVATIALARTSASLSLGATLPLHPVFRDAGGRVVSGNTTPEWTSTNTDVALVDQAGTVRGVGLGGPATIRVVVDGIAATATVTVVPDRLVISPDTSLLPRGTTIQLSGAFLDFNGAAIAGFTPPITWSSSNPLVATVEETTGLVSAVGDGDAVISGAAGGLSAGRTISVGAPSPHDGVWIANYFSASRSASLEFRVLFGGVRRFKLTFALVSGSNICSNIDGGLFQNIVLDLPVSAAIVNNAFAFSAGSGSIGVPVSGTFDDAGGLTVQHGTFSFGSFPCRNEGGGIVNGLATLGAASAVATRQ